MSSTGANREPVQITRLETSNRPINLCLGDITLFKGCAIVTEGESNNEKRVQCSTQCVKLVSAANSRKLKEEEPFCPLRVGRLKSGSFCVPSVAHISFLFICIVFIQVMNACSQ